MIWQPGFKISLDYIMKPMHRMHSKYYWQGNMIK